MRDAIFSFHSPCQQHRHRAAQLSDFPQDAEINHIIRQSEVAGRPCCAVALSPA
jgi:hypothetical protein